MPRITRYDAKIEPSFIRHVLRTRKKASDRFADWFGSVALSDYTEGFLAGRDSVEVSKCEHGVWSPNRYRYCRTCRDNAAAHV